MSDSPHDHGDPDDAALLAQLALHPSPDDAWKRLAALADEFAARPHAEDDVRWERGTSQADGVVTIGYPVYGARVQQACRALAEVGAVTAAYHWTQHLPPSLPEAGSSVSPADAVRLATTVVRGERFCDGTIGEAAERGTLQAILTALATWHRDHPPE